MVIIELSCTQSSEQQITMNYDKKMQQKEYSTAKAKRFFFMYPKRQDSTTFTMAWFATANKPRSKHSGT
jgi:hypothetical protein